MTVRKRGKSYWIDFMFNRIRYRKRSPDNSHKGAVAYELLIRNRLARGEPITEQKPSISYTLKKIALQWLEIYVKNNNKPSEYKIKGYVLNSSIIPYFDGKYINEIKTINVEQFKAFLIQERNFSPKTVNNYLNILSSCFKSAKELEIISDIPKINYLKVPQQKYDYLTEQEVNLLLQYAEGKWHDMILLAVRTGLRFGELIALKWEDINFKESLITVNRSIVRGIEGSPKNNKIRTIPLTISVKNMLNEKNTNCQYVFHDNNQFPLKYNHCLRRLHKTCNMAGLRRISWHKLRHSFASHLAERKNSIIAIKELLGHSDIKTTMRYAHVNLPVLQSAIASLEPENEKIVTILSQPPEMKPEFKAQTSINLYNS
jgi:integrase